MNEYHKLLHYPRRDERTVNDYDVGDFDLTELWKGDIVPDGLPPTIRIYVGNNGDYLPDLLLNPISWLIVSPRLCHVLTLHAGGDLQVFPAPLFDSETGEPITGYSVVNLTKRIYCLDADLSDVSTENDAPSRIRAIHKYVLKRSEIPQDTNVFRLGEYFTAIFWSTRLIGHLRGKNFTGLAFMKT